MYKSYLFLIFLTCSCVSTMSSHGISLEKEKLEKLRIGSTRITTAYGLLGAPSIQTKRDDSDIFLYISYKTTKKPLGKLSIADYQASELIFTKSRLTEIKYYNKKDLKHFYLNPSKTEGERIKRNFLLQFLENLGRVEGSNDI